MILKKIYITLIILSSTTMMHAMQPNIQAITASEKSIMLADGVIETCYSDNSKTFKYPHGRIDTLDCYGVVREKHPDGIRREKYPNGTSIFHGYGIELITYPDKSSSCINTKIHPDAEYVDLKVEIFDQDTTLGTNDPYHIHISNNKLSAGTIAGSFKRNNENPKQTIKTVACPDESYIEEDEKEYRIFENHEVSKPTYFGNSITKYKKIITIGKVTDPRKTPPIPEYIKAATFKSNNPIVSIMKNKIAAEQKNHHQKQNNK